MRGNRRNPSTGEKKLYGEWKLRVPRRRRGQQRKSTAPEIIEAVRMLACKCTDDVIAGVLTRNDLRTGNGNRWTRERVTSDARVKWVPRTMIMGVDCGNS